VRCSTRCEFRRSNPKDLMALPASEMDDLIVELRSTTSGVGTYVAKFDHLAELTGRLADQVLAAHEQAAE